MNIFKACFDRAQLRRRAWQRRAAPAAQLGGDARSAIPKDLQQLIVVDYRAMQNSPAAMQLKNRVMPPEIRQLEEALKNSGLNENHDVDQLAFAAFRPRVRRGDHADHRSLRRDNFRSTILRPSSRSKK